MRKNIDLPDKTVKQLEKMATGDRMKVKPFIEKVLIDYANISVRVTNKSSKK